MAIPNLYQASWEKLLEKIFGHTKFIPVFLGNIVRKRLEQTFLAIPNLYQSFSKKNWNIHFWPFLIYTSPFGKNCQKKIGTSIFRHSWFIPVLLGKILRKKLEQPFLAIPNLYQSSLRKIVGKNSEQPFLAIPNLYQSFWETLSEKDWNKHFWPFLIYTMGKIVGKKIWNNHLWPYQIYTSPFGKHWEKLEHPFLAIPNLYQSFWEKLSEKDGHFFHSKFIPVLLGNIVRKRLGQAFLAIPNLYQSFWEKLLEKKFRMAIFGHSKFIPVFLRKIEQTFFGTSIFGHSKFIPVLLGNIVNEKNWNIHFWPFQIYTSLFGKNCWKKNLEWPFLAIPNLYQSFWETLSKKIGTSIFGHS